MTQDQPRIISFEQKGNVHLGAILAPSRAKNWKLLFHQFHLIGLLEE